MPRARLANSQAVVKAADAVGASQVPKAQLHLQLAREEITRAKDLMRTRRNLDADYALQRAEADAELALMLAKEAPLHAETQAALDQLEALQPAPTSPPSATEN